MDTKRCSICKVVKSKTEFKKLSIKRQQYLMSRCYPCHLAYMRSRYVSKQKPFKYLTRALDDDDKLMIIREKYGKVNLKELSQILNLNYRKIRGWNYRKSCSLKEFAKY